MIESTFKQIVDKVSVKPTTAKELGLNLAAIQRRQFAFLSAKMPHGNKEIVLAVLRERHPVKLLQKHFQLLSKQLKQPLIFVFEQLGTRERERLIRRRVQFMVPGKFLYVPLLGVLGSTPMFSRQWKDVIEREKLLPWAETILIKRLLDESLENKSGVELAKLFATSTVNISNALRELEAQGLCNIIRDGKLKRVKFITKEELWNKAYKLLENPVIGKVSLSKLPAKLPKASETALAHYSMVHTGEVPTFAIANRDFTKLKRQGKIIDEMLEDEKFMLELWKRDPRTLASHGFVDPISLFLSLRGIKDERVQLGLDEIIKNLGLPVIHGS